MLDTLTATWPMQFTSAPFFLFLPLAVGAYFLLPRPLRRPFLLLASYAFYFFTAPRHLPVLWAGTLFSYGAARGIAAAGSQRGKRGFLALGVVGLLLALCLFKYNPLGWHEAFFSTAAAVGISYTSFIAIGYLVDLYRGDVPLEKSLVSHALLLGFFPTVRMGPITRAGALLPQLNDDARRFDPAGAAAALRRMLLGYFKKLAVADLLGVYVNAIYGDLAAHSGASLTLAALLYALQLYFDFSGYSDIALGAAGLLGIRLPENFGTPYFATNFSGFWARWHISLSSFLQEYIFTPLVWSRWPEKLPLVGRRVKKPPVLTSLALTFFISGLWHGDGLAFVVWGGLQGLYRIGEELCHRRLGKPKKHPPFWQRLGKTALVLVLWVESLVFFKVGMDGGTVGDALAALARQLRFEAPGALWAGIAKAVGAEFYGKAFMVAPFLAFVLLCLAAALWADWMQCFRWKGRPAAEALAGLAPLPRWCLTAALTLCCLAGFIFSSGGFDGASFMYGGF